MPPLIGLLQLLAIGYAIYLIALIVYTIWSLTHPRRQTYASAIHRALPGDPGELDPPFHSKNAPVPARTAIWLSG